MTINDNIPAFSVDLTMPQIEVLTKTLGIGINNLMTKQTKVPSGSLRDAASRELNVLMSIQQELFAVVAEAQEMT